MLKGMPMWRNFGTCVGSRRHGRVWVSRINRFRWRQTCTIQVRGEKRKCWWYGLLVHGLAFALFCRSSRRRRRNLEADRGRIPEMLRATAILFALSWAAVAGSFPADWEALFQDCEIGRAHV